MNGEPDMETNSTTTSPTYANAPGAEAPPVSLQVTIRGVNGDASVQVALTQTVAQLKQSIIQFFPQLNAGAQLVNQFGVEMSDFNQLMMYRLFQGSIITVVDRQPVVMPNAVPAGAFIVQGNQMYPVGVAPGQPMYANVVMVPPVVLASSKSSLKMLWITWAILIFIMIIFNIVATTATEKGCVVVDAAFFPMKLEFGYIKVTQGSNKANIGDFNSSSVKSAAGFYGAAMVLAWVILSIALVLLLMLISGKLQRRKLVTHYFVLALCIVAYVLSSAGSGNYATAVIDVYHPVPSVTITMGYGGILSQLTIIPLFVMLVLSCISCCNAQNCLPDDTLADT